MLAALNKKNLIVKEKLLQETDSFDYRFKRYGVNYSILIGFTLEQIDFTQLSSSIRKSDSFVVIDPNLCAVIVDFSNDFNGTKAANRLLAYFQQAYTSKKFYSCIVTASNHESLDQMIDELYYLLTYSVANNMSDMLIDNSYLSEVYVKIGK